MGYYYFDRESLRAAEPFPAPPVTSEPAREAYERVLREAGDTLPVRDSVDLRILREVRDGTGHIVRWVREAGRVCDIKVTITRGGPPSSPQSDH